MRRVFLQKAAATNNSGRSLHKAFLLVTGGLALLGAIPFTCLSLFGQPLSIWLLGERWLTAGRFLEIIAPWMFMIWVTAPSNPIFVVLRRQKLWLLVQTILTLLRLGAFGLAFVIAAGPEWTLQAFVMVTVVGNIVTILMAFMLISQRVTERPDPIAHKL
jgi:O-antigen/teichoic acid export membrane protein